MEKKKLKIKDSKSHDTRYITRQLSIANGTRIVNVSSIFIENSVLLEKYMIKTNVSVIELHHIEVETAEWIQLIDTYLMLSLYHPLDGNRVSLRQIALAAKKLVSFIKTKDEPAPMNRVKDLTFTFETKEELAPLVYLFKIIRLFRISVLEEVVHERIHLLTRDMTTEEIQTQLGFIKNNNNNDDNKNKGAKTQLRNNGWVGELLLDPSLYYKRMCNIRDAFKQYTGIDVCNDIRCIGGGGHPEKPRPSQQHDRIDAVKCGRHHTVVMTRTKRLFVCGSNEYGQLGIGKLVGMCPVLTDVTNMIDGEIITFACGARHTIILTTKGLFACGSNKKSQLGIRPDEETQQHKLSQLQFMRMDETNLKGEILDVVCSSDTTIVSTTKGIFGCGSNDNGNLTMNQTGYYQILTPLVLYQAQKEKQCYMYSSIALSSTHRLSLLPFGKVDSCGSNEYNEIDSLFDHGETILYNRPVDIPATKAMWCGPKRTIFQLIENDQLIGRGFNPSGQLGFTESENNENEWQINLPSKALIVACGFSHTVIATIDNRLFTAGLNNKNQLGRETKFREEIGTSCGLKFVEIEESFPPGKILSIGVGLHHTIVLTTDGLYGCGSNIYGELGIPFEINKDKEEIFKHFTKIEFEMESFIF